MGKGIFVIAGETSGDMHGAHFAAAVRERSPGVDLFGFGGAAMRRAGVEILMEAGELSVVGITEVLAKLPAIRRGFRTAERLLRRRRPDLLVLIDFPDFNLRVAAFAKRLGVPVLYYISPQVWAWRRGRARKIARIVDHMAVILPFEADFYREHGLPVTFVGHPLMDDTRWHPVGRRVAVGGPVVGLVPGSRESEIRRHLPVMLEAAVLARRRSASMRFVVSRSPQLPEALFDALCRPFTGHLDFDIDPRGARHLFGQVDLLLTKSGTVTLEAARAGVPMIVMYRVSPVSYLLGRLLIRVPHIALVNLIAGRAVVPELIQHQASPERIACWLLRLTDRPERLDRMRRELLETADRLGREGASERVADIALGMLPA
jgi:lipid-A-disaccharide synthase